MVGPPHARLSHVQRRRTSSSAELLKSVTETLSQVEMPGKVQSISLLIMVKFAF